MQRYVLSFVEWYKYEKYVVYLSAASKEKAYVKGYNFLESAYGIGKVFFICSIREET